MITNEQAINTISKSCCGHFSNNGNHINDICDCISPRICRSCGAVIIALLRQAPTEKPIPINLSVIPSGAAESESGTYVTGYCTSILYSNGFVLRHITGEEKWEKLPLIPQD